MSHFHFFLGNQKIQDMLYVAFLKSVYLTISFLGQTQA